MARLRNFACYRDDKRPFTPFSKYKKYSYVRSRPHNRIARYTSGKQVDYDTNVHLISKLKIQIRDSAIESGRLCVVRYMEKTIGKGNFFFQIRIFPHHILRENPLASGAGADRLSTGMAHNYGKPIGIAAQVKKGQEMFTLKVNKEHIAVARTAMKRAAFKLPTKCGVTVCDLSVPKPRARAPKGVPKPTPKAAPKEEPKAQVETTEAPAPAEAKAE